MRQVELNRSTAALPQFPTKLELATEWLPRYMGMPIDRVGDYILLTNFSYYVDRFLNRYNCEACGRDRPMQAATNFIVGHRNEIARGALLLVSDVPLTPDGVKTEETDVRVTREWADLHL